LHHGSILKYVISNSIMQDKLDFFIESKRIPNIIFHGEAGSGKKRLLIDFIHKIYKNNKEDIQQYVMYINCAFGKGIKFIREELKHFAKTNIHGQFKSIVLFNAEKLTVDAQSALRRCIEQFNFNTRFFIVTDDKFKLLKPILSRFSELYITSPKKQTVVNPQFAELMQKLTPDTILETATVMYEHAFSAIDLENYVNHECPDHKYKWLMYYSKIKGEFRNEVLLLYVLLYLYVFRTEISVKLFI
jgi:DNA polymerase III delta prime subunit